MATPSPPATEALDATDASERSTSVPDNVRDWGLADLEPRVENNRLIGATWTLSIFTGAAAL